MSEKLKLNINKTKFNKDLVSKMSFKHFEKLYNGKFDSSVILADVFIAHGGKMKN